MKNFNFMHLYHKKFICKNAEVKYNSEINPYNYQEVVTEPICKFVWKLGT